MKCTPLRFGAACAAMAMALAVSTATAAPFTLSCQTYNLATNRLQSRFHPGDSVLIVIDTNFPDAKAVNKDVSLAFKARAKIAGISIPFDLLDTISGPNRNPTVPGTQALVQSGAETRVLKIPLQLPDTTVNVTIKGTIQGIGTAGCSAGIVVSH